MPVGAVEVLILLSIESFKASSRFLHKRKSRKHGYDTLRTDSLGRPLNDNGKRLSKNEARALAAHNAEIERIRTAEREWRARGERLPRYEETNDATLLQALNRPSTAPASAATSTTTSLDLASSSVRPMLHSTGSSGRADRGAPRARTRSAAVLPTDPVLAARRQLESRNILASSEVLAVRTLDGGAFTVRRRNQTISLSVRALPEQPEIEDILQHDGLDWRRATWEAPPIYHEAPASVTAIST
ncbi:hypothetical protein BCV70DRAFT_100876 [Testicularia cyperi]|uniref:Uncharacterized protein n=1 Tax=Testicularia cyperi TaxID=1882483 RepID=A0A317XRA1_9BASI|nr:hypothetical protein BCV70DRAFT_100876 [Testicularia cyperi]